MAAEPAALGREVSALDALELAPAPARSPLRRLASAVWPQLAAVAIALAAWQAVVWSGWRPDYLLPGPGPVLARLGEDLRQPAFAAAVAITMQRALTGYGIAVAIGALLGSVVARN